MTILASLLASPAAGRFLTLGLLVATEAIHRRCKSLFCPFFVTTNALVVHDPFEAQLVVRSDMTGGARFHHQVSRLVQMMANCTIVVHALEVFTVIKNDRSHIFLFVIEHNDQGQWPLTG